MDTSRTGKKGATAITIHSHNCVDGHNGQIRVQEQDQDVVDTRLREAIHIIDQQPTLNKKDELIKWIERRRM